MSGVALSGDTLMTGAVELTETGGRALKLQTDTPHLVSLGGGRLSTAVTLHPIPQGRVTLGSGPNVDIPVQGTGVQSLHCHIENSGGVVTIYPLSENLSIDGAKVTGPTRLSQGVMLTIGRSNYMRFNHPAEAKLMKSVLPNSRISMTPISFEVENNKKPPVVPRKSPRDSLSDLDDAPSSIMMKVSKFEYLAAQNFKKSISPKCFSANLVTVNTPARDVLGKAPPDLRSLAKNLPQSAHNYSDYNEKEKTKTPDRQFFGRKSPQYVNVAVNEPKNINNRVMIYENGCIPKHQNVYMNINVEKDTNFMNNKCVDSSKPSNVNRVAVPSPSYDRNPASFCRSATPSPVPGRTLDNRRSGSAGELSKGLRGVSGSLEDIACRKNEAEVRRKQAHAERVREQEIEKAEQARLEEILNMCAEYEKQVQWEKNNKPTPNRIKTNGSLPRDKRQCISPNPFDSPNRVTPSPNQGKDAQIFQFDVDHYYTKPPEQPRNNYENVEIRSEIRTPDCGSPYENVVIIQPHYPQSPRTRIRTIPTARDASEIVENKFAVLNAEKYLLENNENSHRKASPTKFILPLEDPPKKTATSPNRVRNKQANKETVEKLKARKQEVMAAMVNLKRKMGEIDMQEEEVNRELEMERALITGEHKSKLLELEEMDTRKQILLNRAREIELKMEDGQAAQFEHQEDCKEKLQLAQENLTRVEQQLSSVPKNTPEYDALFEDYLTTQEVLDNVRKMFEDLEFHHLEEEADWLASREEIQREISDLTQRMVLVRDSIAELEQQKIDASTSSRQESKTLERQLIKYSRKLEELRNKLQTTDLELRSFCSQESDQEISSDSDSDKERNIPIMSQSMIETKPKTGDDVYNMTQSFNEKMLQEKTILDEIDKKYPSQDDIDRISKVTSNAPMNIEESRGSLGKKTIESLKEIERNRQLHLVQQGFQVIEEEKRRVLALKQRVQQEVRTQWAQRRQDCSSLTSTGSEDTSITGIESDQNGAGSPASPEQKDSEDSLREDSRSHDSPRPLSETSDVSVEVGGTLGRRRRPPLDKTRPLTRYLPIRSSELDLRQHIESAGHQVVLCPHVVINSTSCRGFLHKRGSKLNGWNRRWFVFDRNKHTLVYYSDKSEKKPRGGAYFQAIEEVYLDHANSVKSPNPHLTFIIKTHERFYYLMAPSPEAMRIWIDVVFTGAEGYQEFDHGT